VTPRWPRVSAWLLIGPVLVLVGCGLGRDDGGGTPGGAPSPPGTAPTLAVRSDLVDPQVVTWRSWRAVEETLLEFKVSAGPASCYGAASKVMESGTEVRVELRVGRLPEASERECAAIAIESIVPVRLAAPLGARRVEPLT
jgi:hypothetical protein